MSLLEQVAKETGLSDGRFPARNFLLECVLPEDRIDGYLARADIPVRLSNPVDSLEALNRFHGDYLLSQVRAGSHLEIFSDTDPCCPETFRPGCKLDEYGGVGEELFLIRVQELRSIAQNADMPISDLQTLLEQVGSSNRAAASLPDDLRRKCAGVLNSWQYICDNRPVFAGFWEDAQGLLTEFPEAWAAELRDRLGLVHIDPKARGVPVSVVVFRYPVRLIPKSGNSLRLLVRPSVLDGTINQAFYTAPPSRGTGCTVDLTVRDDDPWQEVVHPSIRVDPAHVWAVGTIVASPPASLAEARAQHMLKLEQMDEDGPFGSLCTEIDGDLL